APRGVKIERLPMFHSKLGRLARVVVALTAPILFPPLANANGLALTAKHGSMHLTQFIATFTFSGPHFDMGGIIPAVVFAVPGQYPICGPTAPNIYPNPAPCAAGTVVDLSVAIEFLDDVHYTVNGDDFLSVQTRFNVVVVPVTMPALAPSLTVGVPFVLYIASGFLSGAPPGLTDVVVVGFVEATATFTS